MVKFLKLDVFLRHVCLTSIIVDRGAENKGIVEELYTNLRMAKYTIMAYHP